MKTSHKKNRPFVFKLIDLVEPNPVLYMRDTGLSTYERMKTKNLLWQQISSELGVSVQFCMMRWGSLRGQFQKELRNCRELCPKEGVIRGSTWPYLERLRFLENTVKFNRVERIRVSKRKRKQSPPEEELQQNSASSEDWLGYEEDDFKSQDLIDELLEDDELQHEEFTIIDQKVDHELGVEEEFLIDEPHIKPVEQIDPDATSLLNLQKMSTLMIGIEGENRKRVERRIMAFLCKCQLRALSGQGVDDLTV